ncbi:MAG: hypothetical protein HPY64_16750 [Anaerolineae bacterium]|nr:hypothetical protein [Anaerolineae bacterium]
MLPQFIDLGLFSVRTFTALIAAATVVGLALLVATAYRRGEPLLRWLDVGLGGLLGGVIGARLLHVLLNLVYFRDHAAEALNLRAGGLSGHGALYGALLGVWLAARWRRVSFRAVADVLALLWPLGMIAAWVGCLAASCGYGAEVRTLADFPAWMVSETADIYGTVAPRYNTQHFGLWLGAGLLILSGLVTLVGWLRGYRLWLILGLSAAGLFVLGFFRGDGAPGPLPTLTWDQALDLSVIAFSAVAAVGTALHRPAREGQPATAPQKPEFDTSER